MAGLTTLQTFLAFLSFSSFYFCDSFLVGGGSNVDSLDPMQMHKKAGFERDPQIYAHLVIPPWSRPFKLGYCLSWEWNTDVKYRQKRIDICNELSAGKHECESPSGFCKDKCPYVNGSYPYWRLRNADDVPFLWVISSLEFYETSASKKSLTTKPTKAYSSSYFGPGYKPSNAFDNNPDTLWVSNGAAPPGMQWIGYEFPYPVFVGSIRVVAEEDKPERSPAMIYVEASCEKYFRNFVTQWVIHNPSQDADRRYNVFNVAKFTNLGGHGRYGPMSIGTHYHGQDHDGQVTVTNGVQMWKVPATGLYALEAAGASGGYDKFSAAAGKSRGRGARVKGNFRLTKGHVLKIIVGQEGGVNTVSGGSGGGGGTFVFNQNTKKPLLVAGGGGGIDKMKTENSRCHGSASNDGNSGYGGSQLRGGSKGKGAEDGDTGYSGGGGGGLNTDGRNNKNFGGTKGTGGEGGLSFRNGGYGGRSNQNHVEGGFGGGGGPNGAGGGGGGGGGYSGGASGSRSNSCGGGGGSFNAGKEQSNQSGVNTGHGYLIVKLLNVK